jgi:uncharacterized protein YbjT (DUF2867 family)
VIAETGATGNAGRALVDRLPAAGRPVRALTRDPQRAALPDGAEAEQHIRDSGLDRTFLRPNPFATNALQRAPRIRAGNTVAQQVPAIGVPPEITGTVEQVTGTPARTFARWAHDHAEDFTAHS